MKFPPRECDPSLFSRLPGTQFPVSMIHSGDDSNISDHVGDLDIQSYQFEPLCNDESQQEREHTRWEFHNLFLFILVLCCQGVICQFVRNVAMNRSIYIHAECFMRRFKLRISASGTCRNNHATL
jgi:hypothetical protein